MLILKDGSALAVAAQGLVSSGTGLFDIPQLVVLVGRPQTVAADEFDAAGQCTLGEGDCVIMIPSEAVVTGKQLIKLNDEGMVLATPPHYPVC